jgi:hypothetical protein
MYIYKEAVDFINIWVEKKASTVGKMSFIAARNNLLWLPANSFTYIRNRPNSSPGGVWCEE